MQRALQAILKSGDSSEMSADLASFQEREQIVDTARYLALDEV
jgi:hypothetical protein